MNTFGTPRHTRLRFLAASDEDCEPAADPVAEPGAARSEHEHEHELDQNAEDEQNTEEEQEAAHGRYAMLPGRDPIDLEAISDLSLD